MIVSCLICSGKILKLGNKSKRATAVRKLRQQGLCNGILVLRTLPSCQYKKHGCAQLKLSFGFLHSNFFPLRWQCVCKVKNVICKNLNFAFNGYSTLTRCSRSHKIIILSIVGFWFGSLPCTLLFFFSQ